MPSHAANLHPAPRTPNARALRPPAGTTCAHLAAVAQALGLPLAVHPPVEPNKAVPACTAAGNCDTPGGRWAQTCDLQTFNEFEDSDPGLWDYGVQLKYDGRPPALQLRGSLCPSDGQSGNARCLDRWPSLLPGSGRTALSSCLCVYLLLVRQLAVRQLRQITDAAASSSSTSIARPPRLPFAADGTGWGPLLPLGIPGLVVTSAALDRPRDAWQRGSYDTTASDDVWWKMVEQGGDGWWTRSLDLRYASCECARESGLPCEKYEVTGSGDCVETWDGCEWQEDCACVSQAAEGFPQRQSYNTYNYNYYSEGEGSEEGAPAKNEAPSKGGGRAEDGCWEVLRQGREGLVLQVLVEECAQLGGLQQILHLLFNASQQAFECHSTRPAQLSDRDALNAAVYAGHFRYNSLRTSVNCAAPAALPVGVALLSVDVLGM